MEIRNKQLIRIVYYLIGNYSIWNCYIKIQIIANITKIVGDLDI